MSIEVGAREFEREIATESTVLVDFWASWCGPCRAQAPILVKLEQELGDRVKVLKVNVDTEQELAERYEIMTIPTLIVFRAGKQTARVSGLQSLPSLKSLVE